MRLLERLTVENYRGRPVPRVVGVWLAGWIVLGTVWLAVRRSEGATQWGAAAGCGLVFAAGLVDDLAPIGPRGLGNHLRSLAAGRMTTGILKLLVTVGSAIVVVALIERGTASDRLAAVILVAGTTNVWNGLDVRPGRALKMYLVVIATLVAVGAGSPVTVLLSLFPAAVIGLALDLRELAMLGDSGSNLLGFAVGVQLASSLPTWSLWPAAVAAVGLNILAETVTFSRAIEAVPPARWFDRLGQRGEA